eukprot:4711854-Amphidinium_carterae.1
MTPASVISPQGAEQCIERNRRAVAFCRRDAFLHRETHRFHALRKLEGMSRQSAQRTRGT